MGKYYGTYTVGAAIPSRNKCYNCGLQGYYVRNYPKLDKRDRPASGRSAFKLRSGTAR